MPLRWSQVIEKNEYKTLSEEEKEKARDQYFKQVVLPVLPETEIDRVKTEFFNYAKQADIRKQEPSYFSKVVDAASRTAGIGLGIVNSPLAFVWGSQVAQHESPEEYNKMSGWKQALVSTGSGFMSAWESISKKGKWGTLYGDYYETVRGKTIEQDLPDNLKWSAPTLEFMANLVSDPLVPFGEASRIASLRVPKEFIKDVPKQVSRDLMAFEKLEAGEKKILQQKLVEGIQNRADYIKWWEDRVKEMDDAAARIGSPLMKPGERIASDLTAPRQAMAGQPKREFARKVERVKPELSKIFDELKITGKPKLSSAELEEMPLETIRETRTGETLAKINEFRTSKGLEPVSRDVVGVYKSKKKFDSNMTRATAGAVLGIEEDEDGNLRYNVAKGMAGAFGVAAGMKIVPKRATSKFTEVMATFPSWEKVHGMIGKQSRSFTLAGLWSNFKRTAFDRFVPLIERGLMKAYEAARTLFSYKDQAALKLDELKNAFAPVRNDDVIMSDYVDAHRAYTRAQIGLKNPNGVSLADARNAIKEIEVYYESIGKNVEDLRTAMQSFQQWTNKYILKEALDGGFLSQAGYDDIVKNNKWYATFDVLDHLPPDIHRIPSLPTSEYFSVSNQDIIKKMIGTEKLIGDPIEATVKKFTSAQAAFAKNRVASALIDDPVAKEFLRPVAGSPKELLIMKNNGLNPVMKGAWNEKDFGTINRFKEGRVERYIAPIEIAESMKQLSPAQVPRVVSALNDLFRKSATTVYLPFTISNAMRDALMAYTTAPVYKAKDAPKFLKDWTKGFWEGMKHEFAGKSDIAKEYINAGGGFGFSGEIRTAGMAKGVLFKKGMIGSAGDIITSPFKLIEKISSTVELAPRLGIFDRAKMAGLASEDAALMARQSTIDFNRAGTYTKVLNQFVPFLTARVQARVTVAQALKRDWKGTLSKAFVSTTIPGLAAYAWNRLYHSDLYDDIPEYVRQNYFVVITGTDEDDKGKVSPKYAVISKGDLGQMSWNPLEFALDKMWEKDREGTTAFLINYLSDLSPVEIAREGELSASKAAGSLLPPIVKGVAEDWANLKFYTGREIVPYYMGKSKPPELQYKENTPETYKWLGKKLGISPLRLQNFASNIVAGYGREGLDPSAMMRGLTGRIVKTTGGEIENRAWTVIKNIEQGYEYTRAYAEEMIKAGNVSEAQKLMNEWNSKLFDMRTNFNKEFGKYDIVDKGGILKSYRFSSEKRRNLVVGSQFRERYNPLEKRLMMRSR